MKRTSCFILLIAVFLQLLVSCQKEDIHHGFAGPPQAPVNPMVTGITCNGGDPEGTWTLRYYEMIRFRNDTFDFLDSNTVAAGQTIVEYFNNGNINVTDTTGFDFGVYSVLGNKLTLNFNAQISEYFFGVSSSGKMRLAKSDFMTVLGNNYRYEFNYIYERY